MKAGWRFFCQQKAKEGDCLPLGDCAIPGCEREREGKEKKNADAIEYTERVDPQWHRLLPISGICFNI